MKANELVEMYKKNPRIDIEKILEVKKYVSIAYKREMAKLILDNCTTIVDGEVHIDSVERYMLFTIAVIGLHTNLEFIHEEDDEYSVIDDYDLLCESGILVKIIETFKDDYASCQEILNMMTTDSLQDNMTIEKKLYQFLDAIQDILSGTIDGLVDKLDIDNLQLDQDKLLKIYDLIEQK